MISRISRIGEGDFHFVVIVDSFLHEDVETTIGKAFDRHDGSFLTIDLHLGTIHWEHQTRLVDSLDQLGNVGLEAKVNLHDVAQELGNRTILVDLKLDVIEIVGIGCNMRVGVQIEGNREELLVVLRLVSSNLAFLVEDLPFGREVHSLEHLPVDVVAGFGVCLRRNCGILLSTIVEAYAILSSCGYRFIEAEPELVVIVIGCLVASSNHNTARAVDTHTVGNLGVNHLSGIVTNVYLGKEAAHVVAFHVAVVDQVGPAYLLGLALTLNFHALDVNVCPVGSLDGVQMGKALLLDHQFQVDGVCVTVLREILRRPTASGVVNKMGLCLILIPLTLGHITVKEKAGCSIGHRDNELCEKRQVGIVVHIAVTVGQTCRRTDDPSALGIARRLGVNTPAIPCAERNLLKGDYLACTYIHCAEQAKNQRKKHFVSFLHCVKILIQIIS